MGERKSMYDRLKKELATQIKDPQRLAEVMHGLQILERDAGVCCSITSKRVKQLHTYEGVKPTMVRFTQPIYLGCGMAFVCPCYADNKMMDVEWTQYMQNGGFIFAAAKCRCCGSRFMVTRCADVKEGVNKDG